MDRCYHISYSLGLVLSSIDIFQIKQGPRWWIQVVVENRISLWLRHGRKVGYVRFNITSR